MSARVDDVNIDAIISACGGSIDKKYFVDVSVGDEILIAELRNFDPVKNDHRMVNQRICELKGISDSIDVRIRTLVYANSEAMLKYAAEAISHAENLVFLSERSRSLKSQLEVQNIAVSRQASLVKNTLLKSKVEDLLDQLKRGQQMKNALAEAQKKLTLGEYDAVSEELKEMYLVDINGQNRMVKEFTVGFLEKVPEVSKQIYLYGL